MIRLKDIALRAGVSVMTVSKALRDAPDISAATRARIHAMSREMGYVPDSMARSLRNRTTRLFGLLIPSSTNPVFARTVAAIEDRCFELGYDLLLAHSLNRVDREEACLRRLLSRQVDGIFVTPVYRLDPVAPAYVELKRRAVPTVLLGPRAPFCAEFSNVEMEDNNATSAATRHLLELGHRRIAFLAGPATSPASSERMAGYRKALREANIEFDEQLVFNSGATIEEGEQAAAQLLAETPRATAIQAASDLIAIGAANVFLRQGLHIPEDLSLVGQGNTLVSEHFRIPLTTIRQPKHRLGLVAVELMQKLLAGNPPETRRLPAELIIRASTAPPGRGI